MNTSHGHGRLEHRRRVAGAATVAILALGACGGDTTSEESTISTTTTSTTTISTTTISTSTGAVASARSDDEVAGLLWMREEEQLAHDVYTVLGDQWDLRVFENIADSESSHISAVADLLDRYGLDDPAADNEPGTFTDPVLQDLYDQFVADGSESLVAALRVGAMIEELDIVDLRIRSDQTDEPAIVSVYTNLEKGSRNHLRAFVSQLDAHGVTYEPGRLDVADYDAIVSSGIERGRGG